MLKTLIIETVLIFLSISLLFLFITFPSLSKMIFSKTDTDCTFYNCFSSTRKQSKINKYIETQKEKFTQLDLQDVEVREKIKHSKSKNKALQKQLEKDQKKVCWPLSCSPLLHAVRWLYLTLY